MLPIAPKPTGSILGLVIEAVQIPDLEDLLDYQRAPITGNWVRPREIQPSSSNARSYGVKQPDQEEITWTLKWSAGQGKRTLNIRNYNYCQTPDCPGLRGYHGLWCPDCEQETR